MRRKGDEERNEALSAAVTVQLTDFPADTDGDFLASGEF